MSRRQSKRLRQQEVIVSRKKGRTSASATFDEVSRLNQHGISNLLSGKDDEAERYFSLALGQVDCRLSSTSSRNKTILLTGASLSNKRIGCDSLPEPASEQRQEHDDDVVEHDTSKPKPNKTTLLYIYQRQEYDEGMYVYSEPLPLEGPQSESLRSGTLIYNVAQTHVRRGRYYEARKWYEMAIVRMSRVTGHDDLPLILVKIYHNLGHCSYRLGKNEDAMRCYKKAYSIAKKAKVDTYLAATKNSIAVLLFHNNFSESDAALELFEWSLSVYQAHFGETREVATIMNNIGRVHYLKGDYDRALAVYEEALSIRRKVLGESSIDVAAAVCNTGQTYHQRGDLDMALKYYNEFLDLAKGRLGANHRDIAIIYKCMAEIHHERAELPKAKIMYEKALSACKLALGPFHPELASCLNKLGNLHYEMHDLDSALAFYNEGLEVEKIVLDPDHPHILVTLMNIAQIHRQRGNFVDALIKYTEMHALQLKKFGPNSIEVANTISNMGLMEYQLKSYSTSFELYQETLRIQRDHHGTDDHVDIAATLNSIGLVLFNQGMFRLAKKCFSDSLRIRVKLLGSDHRDVAILWYNIATIYLETGEDDLAVKLYKETLRVERLALGNKHHDVILTLQHLGLVHQQRGELDEALKYFCEALEIERTKEGCCHIAVGKLLNLIGNIHLQRARVSQMMDCYVEASRIYKEIGQPNESLVIAGYNFYGLARLHPPCASTA